MQILPKALTDVMDALGYLPGVGPRSAERYSYFLLRANESKSLQLSDALRNLHKNIAYCPITFALMDANEEVSSLYSDPRRDRTTIAIVEDPFDILAIERTATYNGTYHVLGGLISPIDGVGPEQLHIKEIIARMKKDKVKEIILAMNASVEGESTAIYITKQLESHPVKITRLAQGLPIGLDLEYADQITLGRALQGRREI